MSKDPAFLFYSSDFLTGTMFMTDEQVGKYIRLLCAQHQKGRLSEKYMINICKSYDEDVFEKFIKDENGLYYNLRLENESLKRKRYSESRSNNRKGKKKEEPKEHIKNISKTYVGHMENENENENEDRVKVTVKNEPELILYPSFDDFWNFYNKKTDRKKCEPKWNKLKQDTKESIMQHLEQYIPSTPDKTYRKDPSTYLNGEAWNNEIIKTTQNGTGQQTDQNRKQELAAALFEKFGQQ